MDSENNLIDTSLTEGCMPVSDADFPVSREYQNCRFVVLKYVWDNWANDKLVDGKKDSLREVFSDNLGDLYENLVEARAIPLNLISIAIGEVAVKRLKKNNRSAKTARTVAVRVSNRNVLTMDLLSPLLVLRDLVNDRNALPVPLFLLGNATAASSSTTPDSQEHNDERIEQ